MFYETIETTQFFSPKNNEAFIYFNRYEWLNNAVRVLPHLLSNDKEIIGLDALRNDDPQVVPLIKGKYMLLEPNKYPLKVISDVSLTEEWADKFISNQIDEADLEPKKILNQIEKHLKNHVCMSERDYLVSSLWTYGTYCYSMSCDYPYLYVKGADRDYDSTLTKALDRLCFNSKSGAYQTAELLAKDISSKGGTIIFQDLASNEINRFKTIISCGHSSNSNVLARKWANKTLRYNRCDVYSPKAFSNISSKHEELIRNHCIRVSPLAQEAPERYDRENLKPFRDTASMCCLSLLLHFKEVYKEYKLAPKGTFRLMIALAKMLGGEYENLFIDN